MKTMKTTKEAKKCLKLVIAAAIAGIWKRCHDAMPEQTGHVRVTAIKFI
jgi:hypothetical protein